MIWSLAVAEAAVANVCLWTVGFSKLVILPLGGPATAYRGKSGSLPVEKNMNGCHAPLPQ